MGVSEPHSIKGERNGTLRVRKEKGWTSSVAQKICEA